MNFQQEKEMKIYSSVPVYQLKKDARLSNRPKRKRVVIKTEFLNAEGDQFLPFDGMSSDMMTGYVDVDTNEVWYTADGEEFYNAEGEKVKGSGLLNLFKKLGNKDDKTREKGQGWKKFKEGKFVGFFKKKIKAIGRFVKELRGKRKERSSKKEVGVADAPSGSVPKGLPLLALGLTMPFTATGQQLIKEGSTSFVKPLPPATSTTAPNNVVEVDGKKYSAESIAKDQKIAVSTDPATGSTIVGAEVPTSGVVAVKGADGKYDYYPKSEVESKSNTTKWLLIGGGALVLGGLIYYIAKRK